MSNRTSVAEAIVRDLASGPAPDGDDDGGEEVRVNDPNRMFAVAHSESCPWRRAKEWAEAHDG